MGNVVNMKGEPMPENTPQPHPVEQAWGDLFRALAVLREESQKPGFSNLGFFDDSGRTWGLNAILRQVDNQIAFLRRRNT